jgi:hypothetical protein
MCRLGALFYFQAKLSENSQSLFQTADEINFRRTIAGIYDLRRLRERESFAC